MLVASGAAAGAISQIADEGGAGWLMITLLFVFAAAGLWTAFDLWRRAIEGDRSAWRQPAERRPMTT
jgi:hypothetical protein